MVKQRFAAAIFTITMSVFLCGALCAHADGMELHDGDIDVILVGSDNPDNPEVVTVVDRNCRITTTEEGPPEEIIVVGHVKLVGATGKEVLSNGDAAVNLITIDSESSLTVENLTITADTKSAIIVNSQNATLNIGKGGALEGSRSTSYGGGIRNERNGTVNIDGGTVTDCHAQYYGGGIHNAGTLNLNSGVISDCDCLRVCGHGQ